MENSSNQKWVNISFLAVAVIVGWIVFEALFKLTGVFDFETKVKNIDLVIRLVSIGAGGLLFLGLWKSHTASQFMHEVVTELSRVTWPTTKDTSSATVVVVVMVIVTSIILGLLDKFWTLVIQWIL